MTTPEQKALMLVEKNRQVLEIIKKNEEKKQMMTNLSMLAADSNIDNSIVDPCNLPVDLSNYQSEAHIQENEEHSGIPNPSPAYLQHAAIRKKVP